MNRTFEITILYAQWDNPDCELYETARDIHALSAPELVDEDVFKRAYTVRCNQQFVYDESKYEKDPRIMLESIWKRRQGGHRDTTVAYDGTKERSMSVGDIVIVDGTPWMAMRIGFTPLDLEVDQDTICEDVEVHHTLTRATA